MARSHTNATIAQWISPNQATWAGTWDCTQWVARTKHIQLAQQPLHPSQQPPALLQTRLSSHPQSHQRRQPINATIQHQIRHHRPSQHCPTIQSVRGSRSISTTPSSWRRSQKNSREKSCYPVTDRAWAIVQSILWVYDVFQMADEYVNELSVWSNYILTQPIIVEFDSFCRWALSWTAGWWMGLFRWCQSICFHEAHIKSVWHEAV